MLTISGLAKQASQLTMYDIKSYYNQAKNAVLNVSEMEGKVQEATNDDPWCVYHIACSISSGRTQRCAVRESHVYAFMAVILALGQHLGRTADA